MTAHLLDSLPSRWTEWLASIGQPKYRAAQIRKWILLKRANDFEAMTDLPQALRQELAASWHLWTTKIVRHQQSSDGTEKLLLELAGGGQIECVLLRDGTRRSICISSQVGCAMGCVFCASGLEGVDRNLTTGEIIEQMLRLSQLLPEEERLSNIVVMGMGEPLANLDRLLPALEMASSDDGLGISPRRITISTVGLPKAIDRLTTMNSRYSLAVSLHAPDDTLRNRLVPVNQNIGIASILNAADRYYESSGRRLTYEYVLLGGVNDHLEHAQKLVRLLRGRKAMLNVIPYNPVEGLPYTTPMAKSIALFRETLEAGGIFTKFRKRKGDAINAACGQLRRSSKVVELETPIAPSSPSISD